MFPLDRIVFYRLDGKKKKVKKKWQERKRYNGHWGRATNLLSRKTRLHFNIQLSLLSQSMKNVLIPIPITSHRFISITRVRSLEHASSSAKHCQWHFKGSQRVFDGILMLSGFGGFQQRAWWAGIFEVRQQWRHATQPARHQRPPTFFLWSAGSGLE